MIGCRSLLNTRQSRSNFWSRVRYFYQVVFTQTTGDFNSDFGLGSGILFQYLVVLDYAFLTPPDKLKDLHDKDLTRVIKRPLKERALWAIKLYSNPRGIGWAHEPSHLPPRPSPSIPRSRFVISRILLAICCFLVIGGRNLVENAYADKLVTGEPLHQRALRVLSFGSAIVCMLSGVNALISACAVGCGISSPESWPQLFGTPLQVWSIGIFWRRFWHQMIRRVSAL
jgi:hypothetical protein